MADNPTILTQDDVNRAVMEAVNKLYLGLVRCITCETMGCPEHMHHGIQCDECFYKRIPMFSSCPVSDAYFRVTDAQ